MKIVRYLAMPAARIQVSSHLPGKLAWMSCHFSPYGRGISNRPRSLPAGSVLILDDRNPVCGHDPQITAAQLLGIVDANRCSWVLLDFQRPNSPETAAMAEFLIKVLPCQTAVSAPYAGSGQCPVLLSPVPLQIPARDYLAPWQGRQIFLEADPDAAELVLTAKGLHVTPLPDATPAPEDFQDETLHCRYRFRVGEQAASFLLYRTESEITGLLEECAQYGVVGSVSLDVPPGFSSGIHSRQSELPSAGKKSCETL